MSNLGLRLQDNPEFQTGRSIDPERLLEMMSQQMPRATMAKELGVSKEKVADYMKNELGAAAPATLMDSPELITQYKDMATQGLSQRQMATKLNTNVGTVSRQLAALRKAGHLPDYAPMGGTRVPSMPQFPSAQGTAPAMDMDYVNALNSYLRGLQ
jgi:DNA-binding CsgD family transcriptional regulator